MQPSLTVVPPRSGAAFTLAPGDRLMVVDIEGGQVSDVVFFNRHDVEEYVSNGRTIDYASKIKFSNGDELWSNRSNIMAKIVEDTVGVHDFLLTPCSLEMFRLLYPREEPHRGCHGNLASALAPYGISPDRVPVAFNAFMNVPVDGDSGKLSVEPPLSKAGDSIVFEAKMELVGALTACSAPLSNGGSFKPIGFSILPAGCEPDDEADSGSAI